MSRLEKKYLLNNDGTPDALFHAIDCYEKILYHAISDHRDIDVKSVFCDDINIMVKPRDYGYSYSLVKLHLHDLLFNVEWSSPKPEDAFDIISKYLNRGSTVALCTMFDRLPPYLWYNHPDKRGVSNTHLVHIIGIDNDQVYFVDDSGMLDEIRLVRLASNPTVGKILKENMMCALNEYCSILCVDVNTHLFSSHDKFDCLVESIKDNYNTVRTQGQASDYIVGREALMAFSESMKDHAFLDYFTKDFYFPYLVAKRREIFKWCLSDKSDLYLNAKGTLDALDRSIAAWRDLHTVFAMNDQKEYQDLPSRVQKKMSSIIHYEDALIAETIKMSKLCF